VSVSSNIVRTLLEREWVRVVGHRDVPGRPEMFGTTKFFLDYFGLKKLDDLPPLADLSDWESLRVQLNLPEVEDEAGSAVPEITDLPVLYPEIPVQEAEDSSDDSEAAPAETSVTAEDDIPKLSSVDRDSDEVADDLVVSEWPDPAEIGS
ncbi:MAG: SMC-Scp complex subunit ScpB, partial [Gammaproteobacteria bacterium]|nr:SMC-Scp complex subunit ScpB [Gammaproteobacteria bacterium]